jgi:hypothetical protein
MVRYAFIKQHEPQHTVHRLCRVMAASLEASELGLLALCFNTIWFGQAVALHPFIQAVLGHPSRLATTETG